MVKNSASTKRGRRDETRRRPPSRSGGRIRLALTILCFASLFVSCKKTCGDPLTAQRFLETQQRHRWELNCGVMWTCPRDSPLRGAIVGTYPSLEACKAHRPPRFMQGMPQVLAGIEKGRLHFDAEHAQRCLKWLEARTAGDFCDGMPLDIAACQRALVGQLPRDASCALDLECTGDLECSGARPQRGGSDCHGTCRVARDRRCGDVICEQDAYCDRAEPGGKLICKPQVAEGEDCLTKDACSPRAGEPSGKLTFATGGIACNRIRDDDVRRRGVCTATRSLGKGAPCESNIFCEPGLHCIDHTCQPAALGALGDSCENMARCGPGLVCLNSGDKPGKTCAKPLTEGQSCRPTHQCEPHLTCGEVEAGTGTCTPRRPAGEPCTTPWLCQSFICEEGQCEEPAVCVVPGATGNAE